MDKNVFDNAKAKTKGNNFSKFLSSMKVPVIFTIIFIVAVLAVYFTIGPKIQMENKMESNIYVSVFKDLKLKAAYTPEGSIKIFANAKNSEIIKLKTFEGSNLPERESIVIGFSEGKMMKDENLFSKISDKIDNLFGVDIKIGGILEETETYLDMMHFVTEKMLEDINGDDRIFALSDEKESELFYTYDINGSNPIILKFKEGSGNYEIHEIMGTKYYPIILGSQQAEMMREEKEFKDVGDILKDEFGKSFVVAGILEKTDTPLDMLHLVPLKAEDFEGDLQ